MLNFISTDLWFWQEFFWPSRTAFQLWSSDPRFIFCDQFLTIITENIVKNQKTRKVEVPGSNPGPPTMKIKRESHYRLTLFC